MQNHFLLTRFPAVLKKEGLGVIVAPEQHHIWPVNPPLPDNQDTQDPDDNPHGTGAMAFRWVTWREIAGWGVTICVGTPIKRPAGADSSGKVAMELKSHSGSSDPAVVAIPLIPLDIVDSRRT